MSRVTPQFGSIFVIKPPAHSEKPSKEDYQTWNGISRATASLNFRDASLISHSGGGVLSYPVTLEDGTEQRVAARSTPAQSTIHLVAGTQKGGTNDPVVRSVPKTLENLWRQYVQKLPPLTTEQIADRKVEGLLKKHDVTYEKVAFEDWQND